MNTSDLTLDSAPLPTTGAGFARPQNASEEERSECPPPLNWREVLAQVEQGVRELRIARKDGIVAVRSFGTGRPLYVLPGALGDWKLFSLMMWLLRDEFRTVVVDPPVAARGRLPRRRLAVEELTTDLFAAADENGDATFGLFATSVGCLPAFHAMRTAPARIERAILHAASPRIRLSVTERLLAWLGRFSRRPLGALPLFARIQFHNHRRWFPPFDTSRWEFFLTNAGLTPTAILCRRLAALKNANATSALADMATPILLLHGEGEGTAAAERLRRLQAALPHADCRFLPHAGHFPFLTHPHVLAKAVRELLEVAESCATTST